VTRRASELGSRGEERAAAFLCERGFSIIERNFRAGRGGEIDIIARRGDLIVFVEVKRRLSDRFGGSLYAVTEAKKRRIRAVARSFLALRAGYHRPGYTFRFDLIAIQGDEIQWIEDMFR
jgi:putative endonuclease